MKSLCFKFIKDTAGFALTMFLIILIPLSLAMTISLNETSIATRVADKTINYAVTSAVKSAAMMVEPESQAQGNPQIAYKRAYNEFIKSIRYNLILDEYGEGILNSSIDGKIKFWLLIYNGSDKYKGYTNDYKVASYAYYTNENGNVAESITDSIIGFPKTIYVNDDALSLDYTLGSKKVVMDRPGVIAVVQAKSKTVVLNESKYITRWAYGKIVRR